MNNQLNLSSLVDGNVTRYIKPSLFSNNQILISAFDLRDGTPPETYVSFFKVNSLSQLEMLKEGCGYIKKRLRNISKNGCIFLLDISECLEEVNDEKKPLIEFKPENLPHCG